MAISPPINSDAAAGQASMQPHGMMRTLSHGSGPSDVLPQAQSIGDLVTFVEPIHPAASTQDIFQRFIQNPELHGLPVVQDKTIVGLLQRHNFFERVLLGRCGYGFALNSVKNAAQLTEGYAHLVVEAEATVEEVAARLQTQGSDENYDVICVTQNGAYQGTVAISLLVEGMYQTLVGKNSQLSEAKQILELQSAQLREKNNRMEAELSMARDIQHAFVPRHYPTFPAHTKAEASALRFCHRYRPSTELAGDFFSFLSLSDHAAGIFICDVMGHGVRAALVTAVLRGLVEEFKPLAADAGNFMTHINNGLIAILKQTSAAMFATAFYLVVDVQTGQGTYANAGHPAPLHLQRAAGQVVPLASKLCLPGPGLGIFEDFAYESSQIPLSRGDVIMLFTDGLYEVEGRDDYCDEVLVQKAVQQRLTMPMPQLFDALIEAMQNLSRRHQFEDDVCLVGVEVADLMN